jgi:hypothetical protein
MSASWFRRPAVLMAAYVGLDLVAGSLFGTGTSSHRSTPEIAVVVVLAWLAARGSRAARVLLIAGSLAGIVMLLSGNASWWPTGSPAARAAYFACCAAQVCLLVSTPMYQRTRPGWSPQRIPASRFLPVPRLWMAAGSVAAGLLITLLPFKQGLRPFPCPPGGPAGRSCLADGAGYPIAYRYKLNIVQGSDFHWLSVRAPQGIQAAAFAADICLWSLAVLLVVYLVWLAGHREPESSQPWPAESACSPA